MKLKLITPEKTLFEGEVESVSGRSPGGQFEVRPGHGAWISPLETGVLGARRAQDAEPMSFAIHSGLIEVGSDSILVLADVAEAGDEIDAQRARGARERAEGRLRSRPPDEEVDTDRARRALARAMTRLELAAAER